MRKRLVIIGALGVVLIGAVYWYTNRPPEAPPQPPALPRPVTRREPPKPLTPIEPPERKPKAVEPSVSGVPPAPESKEEAPAPREEAPAEVAPTVRHETPPAGPQEPPKMAKPAAPPPETPTPAAPPAAEPPAPRRAAVPPVPVVARPYSVQVASLVVERNATALRNRLEKLGYAATIARVSARITRHHVYAGEFHERDEADRAARRLSADGFSPKLVEGARGQFAVEVGWAFKQNDAIDLARRLQQKHYTSRIVPKTTLTRVYAVRVGAFTHPSETVPVLKALKRNGFAPVVVRGC